MDSIVIQPKTVTAMHTSSSDLALSRLMQLVSPSLPIGSYTYSQGIEWAVESDWINNADDLQKWLSGLLEVNILYLELPILRRMMEAWSKGDTDTIKQWNEYLLASRETSELRSEEVNRARAFYRVLASLEQQAIEYEPILITSQSACYSYACHLWQIGYQQAGQGLLWSWLENLVLSAVKIIPLGQTDGQRVIFNLASTISDIVTRAEAIRDDDIGASSMALAIASAQHETQYTRLFRS
jgi:urease accessory protein